jgi:adenylate cyclase
VLPFVNMSPDPDNEYFADGISEELLNVLVKVEDIGVASRTSSFAYKGRELGAAVIARELKVNHILEGSVRKSGNRVRITAQLIDAVEDRHLWSETYDRELTDIFEIQDEIANAIVAALRGTLGSGEVERVGHGQRGYGQPGCLPAVPEGTRAFSHAYPGWTSRCTCLSRWLRWIRILRAAGRGWPPPARCLKAGLTTIRSIDRQALIMRSEQAAERALALDPSLSMPWVARSIAARGTDFAPRLEMLDRAIAADPRNATAYLVRGVFWIDLGFFERSLGDLDKCLAIDPAYGNCLRWKATVLLVQGDVDTVPWSSTNKAWRTASIQIAPTVSSSH